MKRFLTAVGATVGAGVALAAGILTLLAVLMFWGYGWEATRAWFSP